MSRINPLSLARSFLVVPANRPERYVKALSSLILKTSYLPATKPKPVPG